MSRHTATAAEPLPLEEFAELAEVDQLKAALADALRYLEDPSRPAPANRVRAWRRLAGRAEVEPVAATPYAEGLAGSARAAAKWTEEEAALVDDAIATVARIAAQAYDLGEERRPDGLAACEFTTADVWAELAGRVPVTKGIAAKMTAAAKRGLIANTGRTTYPVGDRAALNHNQRLTVWRAIGGDA